MFIKEKRSGGKEEISVNWGEGKRKRPTYEGKASSKRQWTQLV